MASRHDQASFGEDVRVPRRSHDSGAKATLRQPLKLADYVRQLVDEAPPLDDEQRARLGRILRAHISRQVTQHQAT